MRTVVVLAIAFSVLTLVAGEVGVAVTGRNGEEVPAAAVKLDVRRTRSADGVETFACRLTAQADGARLLRLEARLPLGPGEKTVFDGRKEYVPVGVRTNAFLIEAFPMGAAWNGRGRAVALALGAESGDSYADFVTSPDELRISVRAALLKRGAVYETVFHRIPFDPKYGAMDAFARYYALYPRRFRRNPEVDPALSGINAQYSSWRRADPEPCRFMNATWECCIGASRTWGDVNDREQPVGPRNTAYSWDEEIGYADRKGKYHRERNGAITQAKFDGILSERLGYGYFCGVRNAYYVMALANISNEIAKRHPDSVAVGKSFADGSYLYSTEVFTFPECSWGRDIRRQLGELAERSDVSAVYFDVSRPRGVYRGERLAEMGNVSWDEYGPGVVRSVGSAKLFDYVRTLRPKGSRYCMGVTLNTKYAHLTDIFYADASDSESCPWDFDKPFPLERRLAAGEKGYQLWEGFSPREFDPNFNAWPAADREMLLNALAKFAIHASFRTGASLPVAYMTEYTALMSHAFVRMNAAGWKPVPGARVKGEDWELARYGLGGNSFLTVNNLSNVVRQAALEVYPEEIASGCVGGKGSGRGWLYVPFYGGRALTRLARGREGVTLRIGSQLVGVLEAVGELKGEGELSSEWGGDFDALKLEVVSSGFAGEVRFMDAVETYVREGEAVRRISPGERLSVVYRNAELKGALGTVRMAKPEELSTIRCAADADSREIADRIATFFAQATGAKKPTVAVDGKLAPLSVSVGGVLIVSDERWELSRLVNRFLNVVNRERFPDYRPPVPMVSADRPFFPFLRY